MKDDLPFDETTRCHDRLPHELWKPYAFREHREERDRIFGQTPDTMLLESPRRPEHHNSRQRFYDAKPEYHISRQRFYDAYKAVCFANFMGASLTGMITINWETCGFKEPELINKAYNRFAERLRKFYTDKGYTACYLTVFENAPKIGYHSHTLVWVPYALKAKMERWAYLAMRVLDPYAVRPHECYQFRADKPDNFVAQWNRFRYVMKCLDDTLTSAELKQHGGKTARHLFELHYWPHKQSDRITIQRIRIARALNTQAQATQGYRPAHDIADTTHPARERYSDAEFKRGELWRLHKYLASMQVLR